MRDGEKMSYWTLQLLVACFSSAESLDNYGNSIFKMVMMLSADTCTCRLSRWSDEMLVVAIKQKTTYAGTSEHEWERGASSVNITKLTHHRTTATAPTATSPDMEKERMRYRRSGHAVRLFKLLPSYLIPVWAHVCACLYLHTCAKKWLLELFRASRVLM